MSEYIALFEKYETNARWFGEHYEDLVKLYDREFVAVFGGKVADHDRNLRRLIRRIESSFPPEEVYVEYITSRKLQFVL